MRIALSVNGSVHELDVPAHTLLVDVLREHLGLTGTHVGCDTSQCGACTVMPTAAQLSPVRCWRCRRKTWPLHYRRHWRRRELHPMQASFREHHGLQCGFAPRHDHAGH